MLSIILITLNEARNIQNCLNGLLLLKTQGVLAEIIIVDGGSSDATHQIIEDFCTLHAIDYAGTQSISNSTLTLNVTENTAFALNNWQLKCLIKTDWQGFGVQKNSALQQASQPWVLSLDADECLSAPLALEIAQLLHAQNKLNQQSENQYQNQQRNQQQNQQISTRKMIYAIRRDNYFMHQAVQHSGWQKDWVLRLWQHGCGIQFTNDQVHERLNVMRNMPILHSDADDDQDANATPAIAQIQKLKQALKHHPYQNYEDVLRKIQQYSTLGAHNQQRAKQVGFSKAFTHGAWAFMRTYFLQLGMLDGSIGFNIALMNALASYYKYLKLAQCQGQQSHHASFKA